MCRKIKGLWSKVIGKPSLNRATKWYTHDPKPGEQSMTRVNLDEDRGEARTHAPCNTRGLVVDSGEIPIELGNSWFSSK